MAVVNAPDVGVRQIDIGNSRYTADAKGQFHVADEHVRALKRNGECFAPQTGMAHVRGFTCLDCGFAAVLKPCGRCGSTNMRKEGS